MVNLSPILCAAGAVIVTAWAAPAMAQSPSYNCVNESKQINIPAQSMAAALDKLSKQTNCPISRDARIDGVKSRRVRGTYTPEQALKALVRGTGLTGQSIREGLQVTGGRRGGAQAAAPTYDCQNVSIRVNIPAMPLDRALTQLSQQTKCPISRDFQVSGLISRPVKGSYTPSVALTTLLGGTGLRAGTVRQGLQVLPVR